MPKNIYNAEFSKTQYNIWHYNDVKKRADEALSENNKELHKFLTEYLYSQLSSKPSFEGRPG